MRWLIFGSGDLYLSVSPTHTVLPQMSSHACEAILADRFACRDWEEGRQVPEEVKQRIMLAAQRAPSSFNTQPWLYVSLGCAVVRPLF